MQHSVRPLVFEIDAIAAHVSLTQGLGIFVSAAEIACGLRRAIGTPITRCLSTLLRGALGCVTQSYA